MRGRQAVRFLWTVWRFSVIDFSCHDQIETGTVMASPSDFLLQDVVCVEQSTGGKTGTTCKVIIKKNNSHALNTCVLCNTSVGMLTENVAVFRVGMLSEIGF